MAINRNNGGITGVKNKTSRGGNTITTMKASGNFQVQPGTNEVDLLVVAGGGGSGGDQGAGGGGAGGFQNLTNQSVSPGSTIPVTVGAGGAAGGTGTPEDGTSGGNSVFNNPANVVTSIGGGGGGLGDSQGGGAGVDGGSGGGGGGRGDDAGGSATSGQGNAGGKSKPQTSPTNDRGGGGGGAGAAGGDGANDPGAAGNGGAGAPSTITGTDTDYAGGGGGGSESTGGTAGGNGGSGGGGAGGLNAAGKAGQNNSGGGGGASGSAPTAGGAGGSGVVIIKEKDKANGMFNMNSQYHSNKKAQWPNPSVYDITNSLRLYGTDNYEHLAHSSNGNTKTMTFSFWFKDCKIDSNRNFFGHSSIDDQIFIRSDNQFQVSLNNSNSGILKTNRVFRDPAAWYHIVIAIDTSQSTAADRLKLYINGTQEISFATETYPAQDITLTGFNTATNQQYIGRERGGNYFGGYMADVNFIDGQALHCGHFGKVDPDNTRIWIPKNYEGTYGTNGYKLEFKQTGTSANSSGIGADTSGNDHHWTPNNHNSTHITQDTPTNNFILLNPLAPINGGDPGILPTFSEGNTKASVGNSTARFTVGTFATTMPYYFEAKVTAISASDSDQRIGIVDGDAMGATTTYNAVYQGGGVITATGESNATGKDTLTANDIIGVAVDLAGDNSVKFYENGDLQATMAVGAAYRGLSTTPFSRLKNATTTFEFNFGDPGYSVSSGNADANGYGNFEYAVPSGYYALCTKNLAQYG